MAGRTSQHIPVSHHLGGRGEAAPYQELAGEIMSLVVNGTLGGRGLSVGWAVPHPPPTPEPEPAAQEGRLVAPKTWMSRTAITLENLAAVSINHCSLDIKLLSVSPYKNNECPKKDRRIKKTFDAYKVHTEDIGAENGPAARCMAACGMHDKNVNFAYFKSSTCYCYVIPGNIIFVLNYKTFFFIDNEIDKKIGKMIEEETGSWACRLKLTNDGKRRKSKKTYFIEQLIIDTYSAHRTVKQFI